MTGAADGPSNTERAAGSSAPSTVMNFYHLLGVLSIALAGETERIRQLEGELAKLKELVATRDSAISQLVKDLEAARRRETGSSELFEAEARIFAELRESRDELVGELERLRRQPRIYYNSPDSVVLEKDAVQFRAQGKHQQHLEKQILALLKELDESCKAAKEKDTLAPESEPASSISNSDGEFMDIPDLF